MEVRQARPLVMATAVARAVRMAATLMAGGAMEKAERKRVEEREAPMVEVRERRGMEERVEALAGAELAEVDALVVEEAVLYLVSLTAAEVVVLVSQLQLLRQQARRKEAIRQARTLFLTQKRQRRPQSQTAR